MFAGKSGNAPKTSRNQKKLWISGIIHARRFLANICQLLTCNAFQIATKEAPAEWCDYNGLVSWYSDTWTLRTDAVGPALASLGGTLGPSRWQSPMAHGRGFPESPSSNKAKQSHACLPMSSCLRSTGGSGNLFALAQMKLDVSLHIHCIFNYCLMYVNFRGFISKKMCMRLQCSWYGRSLPGWAPVCLFFCESVLGPWSD